MTAMVSVQVRVPQPTKIPGVGQGSGSGGGGGPVTQQFSSAQVSPGLTGFVSTTKNAARVYGIANKTIWSGVITGTEAYLTATSDFGANADLIYVSIDGAAFTSCSKTGAEYILYSGLPQQARYIQWRFGPAFADAPYIASSGNVLRVEGLGVASMTPHSDWASPGDGNGNTITSYAAATSPAQYAPATYPNNAAAAGKNIPSVSVLGSYSELVIAGAGRYLFLSVDGGSPTRYDTGISETPLRCYRVTGLSGQHTYRAWDGRFFPLDYPFSMGGVGASIANISSKRRMDDYGDSITAGTSGATTGGDTDVFKTGCAIGFSPSQYGVSGNTIADLKARIDTLLALKTVSSSDVAVLHIGRNNVGASFDSTEISDYQYIVSAMLTKGYGFVLCSGLYVEGANQFLLENASISAIVTGFSDSRVKFVDVSTWTGIAFADGTHPTDAGYATIAGYATTSYTTLLGL